MQVLCRKEKRYNVMMAIHGRTKETHSGPNMDAEVSVSAKLCCSSFTVSPKIDAENRISYLSGLTAAIMCYLKLLFKAIFPLDYDS